MLIKQKFPPSSHHLEITILYIWVYLLFVFYMCVYPCAAFHCSLFSVYFCVFPFSLFFPSVICVCVYKGFFTKTRL